MARCAVRGFCQPGQRVYGLVIAPASPRAPPPVDGFSSLAAVHPTVKILSLPGWRGYTLKDRTGPGSLMMHRRALLLAAMAGFAPTLAMADEGLSGQWQAHLSGKVLIAMDILEDGHWASQTVQNNKVVAQMAGTYEQEKTNRRHGTLRFTPVTSKVSEEHGAAKVEIDKYTFEKHGNELRLVSTNGDVMVFMRQALAK